MTPAPAYSFLLHFAAGCRLWLAAACLAFAVLLSACNQPASPDQTGKELLIYCGTTMAKPIRSIADQFEQRYDCEVKMILGGSGELLRSITVNRQGDLFLPGMASYIRKAIHNGLVLETVRVGYNQAVIVVAAANPLQIDGRLENFANPRLKIALGNPEMASIGFETRQILQSKGIYEAVNNNVIFFTTDSQDLTEAIIDGKADLTINWRAAATAHQQHCEIIPIAGNYAPAHELLLGRLIYSIDSDLADSFMQLTVSDEGRAIFSQYGFHPMSADEHDS